MATTALPAVAKRLTADMQAALSVDLVSLGVPLPQDYRSALMVMVTDPLSESALSSASSDLAWATTGLYADISESGTVTCAVVTRDGGDDMTAPLDSATTILAAVEAWARSANDMSLGIATLLDAHVSRTEWASYPTDAGVEVLLVFDVAFNAYLPA